MRVRRIVIMMMTVVINVIICLQSLRKLEFHFVANLTVFILAQIYPTSQSIVVFKACLFLKTVQVICYYDLLLFCYLIKECDKRRIAMFRAVSCILFTS